MGPRMRGDDIEVEAPPVHTVGIAKELKTLPKFRSEAEERRFWETHDSTDYIDWSKAGRVTFPNPKRTPDLELSGKAPDDDAPAP